MPGSHWLLAMSPENFEKTRDLGFTLLGMRSRHRKKAERMAVGDRVLLYVLQRRTIPAALTVASSYFEDRHPVWVNRERKDDPFPYRVHTRPHIILQPGEGLDAEAIVPRLLYVKRWPPELWYLAVQGDVHLLSAQDYALVEREMERVVERRAGAERPPRHVEAGPNGPPRPRALEA